MKVCPNCGKEYTLPYPSSKQKYCSAKCGFKARIRPAKPEKKTIFTCINCGKEFETWTYRQQKCCSKRCASKMSTGHPKPTKQRPDNFVTKKCLICKKPYTIHKIFIEKRKSNFCSRDCQAEYFSIERRGERNPNWTGGHTSDYGPNWERQKRKAKKRDNYTCQVCGYIKYGKRKIDTHHIKPYKDFNGDWERANQLDNLITLCKKCHPKVEKGKILL